MACEECETEGTVFKSHSADERPLTALTVRDALKSEKAGLLTVSLGNGNVVPLAALVPGEIALRRGGKGGDCEECNRARWRASNFYLFLAIISALSVSWPSTLESQSIEVRDVKVGSSRCFREKPGSRFT
jgi:hypothetical protein